MPIILAIMILGYSCSDSSSAFDSLMTYEVKSIDNLPIEEFANNFRERFYPVTITLEDYEPESDFSGSTNINNIGSLSIARACVSAFDCFIVDLDSTYLPVEALIFFNLKIDNKQMKGQFIQTGPTIQTHSIEFSASRVE